MNNTILLIDGSSFIFHTSTRLKNLSAPNGMPTKCDLWHCKYAQANAKRNIPRVIGFSFRCKGKTFRDEILSWSNKTNRRETPDELKVQFPYIHELIADLGIQWTSKMVLETDDVIATIAKNTQH